MRVNLSAAAKKREVEIDINRMYFKTNSAYGSRTLNELAIAVKQASVVLKI